jgi:membrane protein YdbS with pleckstrin-like domain
MKGWLNLEQRIFGFIASMLMLVFLFWGDVLRYFLGPEVTKVIGYIVGVLWLFTLLMVLPYIHFRGRKAQTQPHPPDAVAKVYRTSLVAGFVLLERRMFS